MICDNDLMLLLLQLQLFLRKHAANTFASLIQRWICLYVSSICIYPVTTIIYSASQKSSPLPKTFCNIFIEAKYISVKFCQFVASVNPHMLTNSGRFILLFNKMALIFIGVLIVFTVSSFEFQQVRLPWLHWQQKPKPVSEF